MGKTLKIAGAALLVALLAIPVAQLVGASLRNAAAGRWGWSILITAGLIVALGAFFWQLHNERPRH